mgnify:CR=1 FL=1
MIMFTKNKPKVKKPLPIWLDDCYNEKLGVYPLDKLSAWFKQVTAVDWGSEKALSLTLSTKTETISDYIGIINTFIMLFDPMDTLERNIDIPLPLRGGHTVKTYYEYFTTHEKMEFHPTRAASGMAILLTRINEKLLATPERNYSQYRSLVFPIISEAIVLARALEIIYVIE